jgi:phosphoglycerate dehydrogenase-like enzyme
MENPSTVRILLSRDTAARLHSAIEQVLSGRPYEILLAEPTLGHGRDNVDIAYISREVTGGSTKHVVMESLQAFYESLRGSAGLKWVHVHSAGLDRPIFPELKARGVTVTPSAGSNAGPVVQTALAGLLALARNFPELLAAQRQNKWMKMTDMTLPRDLSGQTVVIVGWGSIGQQLAALLTALGLKIVAVRSSATPVAGAERTVAFEDLHQVLPSADWLLLACPLTDRTRAMVDKRAFAAMPRGARLVNVARGECVLEADLIDALQSGQLDGAYLDVYEHEPLDAASPLWAMKNVIATPHAAGHSDGNLGRVDSIFLDLLRDWLAQHP